MSETKRDLFGVPADKTQALLEFWDIMWRRHREIVVFSNTDEAMAAGLPTLATMSELARRVSGVSIRHYGMGLFGAKSSGGEEIFTFDGGGAMHHSDALNCAHTFLSINSKHRRLVLKLMREICPKAFAYVEKAKAQRKAEKMQESEEQEESDTIIDGVNRELYEAAVELLKSGIIPECFKLEARVIRLQGAVNAVKAFKS